MRELIEKGRVVEFKCRTMPNLMAVVLDFITQESLVVLVISARTGKTVERKVINVKHLILTKHVVEVNSESRDEEVEKAAEPAIQEKRESKEYAQYLRNEKMRELNDFERFMAEQEEIAREKLLKSKGY